MDFGKQKPTKPKLRKKTKGQKHLNPPSSWWMNIADTKLGK